MGKKWVQVLQGNEYYCRRPAAGHLGSKPMQQFCLFRFALEQRQFQGDESDFLSLVQLIHWLDLVKATCSLDDWRNFLVALTGAQGR